MVLDTRKFRLHLKTETFGREFHLFERVDSTNRVGMELLRAGAPEGTTVLAEEQTGGRGSSGRTWQSSPGGVYLSVILRPELLVAEVFQLTILAALGVVQALGQASGAPIKIKWPNDLVVVDGERLAKVGGILTETRIQGESVVGAVVGVGVNWENLVPESGACLQTFSRHPLDLALIAASVLGGLEDSYTLWRECGISPIVTGYERHCIHLGQPLQVAGHDGPGRIIGIDHCGALRVLFLDSTEAVVAPNQLQLGYVL